MFMLAYFKGIICCEIADSVLRFTCRMPELKIVYLPTLPVKFALLCLIIEKLLLADGTLQEKVTPANYDEFIVIKQPCIYRRWCFNRTHTRAHRRRILSNEIFFSFSRTAKQ